MTDKILYSPKEGTTGFWGLRDYPNEPKRWCECDCNHCAEFNSDDPYTKSCILGYEQKVESCKSNKMEIVNPEVIVKRNMWGNGNFYIDNGPTNKELKPGDIFDLPIGYEFEKGGYCEGCRRAGMYNCAHFDTCGHAKEVLRLVKTDMKEEIEEVLVNGKWIPINRRPPMTEDQREKLKKELKLRKRPKSGGCLLTAEVFPQPEPEESQTVLVDKLIKMVEATAPDYLKQSIMQSFTIQRKKQ